MRIDVLTLFPQMFEGVFDFSIIGKARERGLVDMRLHDIRTYTHDKHHVVDDYPFGGGHGMVLKPEPIFKAVEAIVRELDVAEVPIVLLSPQGRSFNQEVAQRLSRYQPFVLICGRYEGVDERVVEHLANDEISIGDYVLGGGEVAAAVVVDAAARFVPGVVGKEGSVRNDSFSGGILDYPQYTRPREVRGLKVPAA